MYLTEFVFYTSELLLFCKGVGALSIDFAPSLSPRNEKSEKGMLKFENRRLGLIESVHER